MREDKFKSLEKLFLDYFDREAKRITLDFADIVNCRAYASFPPNEEPQFGYFSLYIDCILKNVEEEKTDNISLGVLAYDLNDKVTMNAEICSGDPYGQIVEKAFDEPIEVNSQNSNLLEEKMPELISILRKTIKTYSRGI